MNYSGYTSSCYFDTVFFEAPNPLGLDSAWWNFNYPSTYTMYHYARPESEVWFIYSAGGIYTVELITKHGNVYDTLYADVYFSQMPVVDLGLDTTLCGGDSLYFDLSYNDQFALDGSCDYLWEAQIGGQTVFDSSATYAISQARTYIVTVYADSICGFVTDVINVDFNPSPIIYFGADTLFVSPLLNFILNPNTNGTNYHWSDGSSDSILIVSMPGMYSVTVANVYGCTAEDSIYVALLGVDEFGIEHQLSIFPNPAQDKLFISFKQVQVAEIRIYSSTGNLISKKENVESFDEVNTQNLSEGIYFVKILTKGGSMAIKPFSVIR